MSILCVAFLAVLQPVYAHPPSDILLDYDLDSQTLQVTLVHTVSDPVTHYVHRIQISLQGTVTTYEYESQPTDSRFTYQFVLPASPGDTVEVKADCNLSGSISGLLIIGGPMTVRSVPELWPFHAALMVSGLFLAILAANSAARRTPKTSWLRIHKVVGIVGVILVVCGLSLAFYMVSATGGPHFKVYHAHLGIVTLIFTVLTPAVGIISLKRRPPSPGIRKAHIWISRITLVLLIVTLTSGMIQAGLI
jgi:cytochrome b561